MDENKSANEETKELVDTEQEHLTEDTDADTKDLEDAEKADEEQEVKDSDADTRDVLEVIDRLADDIASVRAQLTSMKDMFSQFVDGGGVIREDDVAEESFDNDDTEFVPIEELNLSL